jgi:four helix bundle protein
VLSFKVAKSIVKQKSYDFALEIIRFCTQLREQKHFEISNQLLRCGTSIGANVEEALAGQSRKDFVAKMSIGSKEAREANYWLRLVTDAGIVGRQETQKLIEMSEELIRILTSIVKTGSNKRKGISARN